MNNLIEVLNEKGEQQSPKLAPGLKNYLIDIDGIICDDCPNEDLERMKNIPEKPNAKEKINQLFEKGNIITFFTSRTKEEHSQITKKWLLDHGFKYHNIIFNKPRGGNYVFIDDRGLEFKNTL